MENIILDYALIIIAMVIAIGAQWYINHNYKKFANKYCENGISGADAARKVLDNNGLQNVAIKPVAGTLTDYYDPRNKTVNLSEKVYTEKSIASISVAAHECGHAIQDKDGYLFLRIRRAMVPIVNFSSYAGYLAIVFGLFFSWINLIEIGIILEVIILAFQLVTLPVEFNASKRALKQIQSLGLLNANEYKGGKKMLVSAALTYVASVATAIIQILRLLLILGRRNRD